MPTKTIPCSDSNPPQHAIDRSGISAVALQALELRNWERNHLPSEGSPLAFELLMTLASWSAAEPMEPAALLKRLYLALPYSEKGVRLHLRRMEVGGWAMVQRGVGDSRAARVELTERSWTALWDYANRWRQLNTDNSSTAE